jgi:hypothetical protein
MKLNEALLCIECEGLFALSTRCPECGSQVAYPLSRALNRPVTPARTAPRWPPAQEAQARPRPVAAGAVVRTLKLLQSA